MADISAAAGVGRTTLHSKFPSQRALLIALAWDAMGRIEDAYREAQLDQGDAEPALHRAVELLVPLGAQMEFLLRERSLDDEDDLVARHLTLHGPLETAVTRAQAEGTLRRDLPGWWLVESLISTVHAAWEATAGGRMAHRDAPQFVLSVVLEGAMAR